MSRYVGVVVHKATREELGRSDPLDFYSDAYEWACNAAQWCGKVVIRVVVVE